MQLELRQLLSMHQPAGTWKTSCPVAHIAKNSSLKVNVFKFTWQDSENKDHCGIFTMLNMEKFKGDEANLAFRSPDPEYIKGVLESLRIKYSASILTSQVNTKREDVIDNIRQRVVFM